MNKTVVKSDSGNYFWVSDSFEYGQNETMIFECDESGEVSDWGEKWCTRPANHQLGIEVAFNEAWDKQEEES